MDVTRQGEAFQHDLRDTHAALNNARERIRQLVAERDEALAARDRVVIERNELRGVLTGQQQQPAQTFPIVAPNTMQLSRCPGCGAYVGPGHICSTCEAMP